MCRPQSQRDGVSQLIDYTCSLFAIPFASEEDINLDARPHLIGNFCGVNINCYMDTGAAVSCLSRRSFVSIPNYQALEPVPVQPGFRLSAASGHTFSLIGCFRIEVQVLGRSFERPFYVIDGPSKCEGIFGIDFIRETQLCISGDHLFYQKLPFMDNIKCSVLTATEALTVPPLSVIRVPVKVKSARGKKILSGTYGIYSTAHNRLGVWDSLNRVNQDAIIFSVLTNTTNDEQFYKTGDIVGFFQPVPEEDIVEHGLPEARIDEMFSDFSREPKDPIPGASSEKLTDEDRKFLEDSLIINAPGRI